MSLFDNLTWTCHVCGRERPDEFISVMKRDESGRWGDGRVKVETNLRFCNDRPQCMEAAGFWLSSGSLLREVEPPWWRLIKRAVRALVHRRFPGCIHPYPTYADERLNYGYRCGVCFIECEPVRWP